LSLQSISLVLREVRHVDDRSVLLQGSCDARRKKRKKKAMPSGDNSVRSQVLHQPAQGSCDAYMVLCGDIAQIFAEVSRLVLETHGILCSCSWQSCRSFIRLCRLWPASFESVSEITPAKKSCRSSQQICRMIAQSCKLCAGKLSEKLFVSLTTAGAVAFSEDWC